MFHDTVGLYAYALADHHDESGTLRGNRVNPGGQCHDAVPTLRIGRRGVPLAGRHVLGNDTNALDRHPIGIVNSAGKFPKLLGSDGARPTGEDQHENG